MLWEHLREEEFDQAIETSKGVCVIPVGSLEKHGQHLPVGTDILKAAYIIKKAAQIEPVCVFPDFTFGDVQGLTMWKGSVILSAELMQRLLTELCDEIGRNGFTKILLFNSHGGNKALLTNFVRSTMYEKKSYVVVDYYNKLASPQAILDYLEKNGAQSLSSLTNEDVQVLKKYVESKKISGHACFAETAAMLGCYPELVDMDRIHAESGLPKNRVPHLKKAGLDQSTRFWLAEYPNSYAGHAPEGCNERIGKAAVHIMIEQAAHVLGVLKQDEEMLKINDEWNRMW